MGCTLWLDNFQMRVFNLLDMPRSYFVFIGHHQIHNMTLPQANIAIYNITTDAATTTATTMITLTIPAAVTTATAKAIIKNFNHINLCYGCCY